MKNVVTLAVALGLAGSLVGCGSGADGSSDDAGTPNEFIAFTTTFEPFRTWTSFHSDGPPDNGTYTADVLGPRTQYINKLPPHGSTQFPVGTVIVEVRENGTGTIFGAVKRGNNFNSTGAVGWEWFDIYENPVSIHWRGLGPPAGETYGGDPNGGCNSCHTACGLLNDYICSSKLQLASF